MKLKVQDSIKIPEKVTVSIKGRIVTVKGPKGTLVRDLRHLQLDMHVNKKSGVIMVRRWFGNKLDNALIKTTLSAIRNMITGVTVGFRFKLRFAYAHFPINVSVEGQNVEIRNFLGEKRVRRATIPKAIKVFRTDVAKVKDEIVLEGTDLNQVSVEAAKLHHLCAVKNKDIRMFLDGIYVQTKENQN